MNWLFDSDGFVPRAYCGNWTILLICLYITPNVIIALCYWWIPFNGLLYWRGHREGLGKHKKLLIWYAAFIFWCGMTHFFDVIIFKWAVYNLNIVALNIAAVFSLKAAWHTRAFLRDAIKLPSRKELHDAVDRLSAEKINREADTKEKDILIKDQRASIARLTEIIETQVWIVDKDLALKELASMLERMKGQ